MAGSLAVTSKAASAIVVAEGKKGKLGLFNLCSGSDAATALLETGGSGGTTIAKLAVSAASQSVSMAIVDLIHFSDGLYVTITGTTAVCAVGVKDIDPD